MNVAPSATYEAVIDWGSSGATVGMRVVDNAGNTTVARVTGFTEYPTGSGIYYRGSNTAPSVAGQYTLVYDDDGGTAAVGHVATEDLLVTSDRSAGTIGSGNLYVTLTELKATLSISATTWDDDLTVAITAASRAIDEECGRRFYLDSGATAVRYYTPDTSRSVAIDDLATLTSVYIDPAGAGNYTTAWTQGTHFHLAPYNAAEDGWPYDTIELRTQSGAYLPGYTKSVKVTGQFGWPAVPAAISEATGILAARLFKRQREAPLGVFGLGADGTTVRISRTDPDVAMLIKPYNKARLLL